MKWLSTLKQNWTLVDLISQEEIILSFMLRKARLMAMNLKEKSMIKLCKLFLTL